MGFYLSDSACLSFHLSFFNPLNHWPYIPNYSWGDEVGAAQHYKANGKRISRLSALPQHYLLCTSHCQVLAKVLCLGMSGRGFSLRRGSYLYLKKCKQRDQQGLVSKTYICLMQLNIYTHTHIKLKNGWKV